jgi:hypothetical protein
VLFDLTSQEMFQYEESVDGNEEGYPPQEYRSTRSPSSRSRRKSRNRSSSPRSPYYEGEEQTYEEEESYQPSPSRGRPPRHGGGRSVRYEDDAPSVAEYSGAGTPKYADAASVAQSVAYTAYTMNMDSGEQIIEELRNVGVNVLSVESAADMFTFIDEVTKERSALAEYEQRCMLYTDEMERVFNVVISVRTSFFVSFLHLFLFHLQMYLIIFFYVPCRKQLTIFREARKACQNCGKLHLCRFQDG